MARAKTKNRRGKSAPFKFFSSKPKSGNGTTATQDLYLFFNLPYFWIVKIGISGNAEKRRKEVDESAPGIDFLAWSARLPYAYQLEQWMHTVCRSVGLQARFSGSGHTERFYFPAAIIYFFTVLFSYIVYYTIHLLIVAVIIWALFLVESKNQEDAQTEIRIHDIRRTTKSQ